MKLGCDISNHIKVLCHIKTSNWSRTHEWFLNFTHDIWKMLIHLQFSSVQFSRSVVSDSLRPHELQCARPSLSITNSQSPPKPMSIESVMPSYYLILCCPILHLPSIFPSIMVFQMSQLFASGGQRIGVSAATSVLPMNAQDWSPLEWTGWISLQTLKSLVQHHSSKASTLWCSAFFIVQLLHSHMTTGRTVALTS